MGEPVIEVRCTTCPGVMDRVTAGDVEDLVHEHYAQLHRADGPPVAGRDYEAVPAPSVCDPCGGILELPWWQHVSTPPTDGPRGEKDSDGLWLLCDRCHELHAAGRLSAWVRSALQVQISRAPWVRRTDPEIQLDMRAYLAATLRLLLERLDDGRRVALNDGR